MKKYVLLLMMAILMASYVFADEMQSYVDQPTSIVTACIRNSQMRTNVNVTVKIYDSIGTLLVAGNSTSMGNGTFEYIYTFDKIGAYSTKETCDFGDYLADGSTSINVVKPSFGNIQVIAQSVDEVSLNKTARSEWLLLLPNSTNSSQSAIVVTGGVCGVYALNGTELAVSMTTTTTSDHLATEFVADPAYGFAEDENYEIVCNLTLSQGLMVNGVKNFLYVNPHMTYWQFIVDIFSSLAGIQDVTNQTLSISNQTLQIVTSLNNTGITSTIQEPKLLIPSIKMWIGSQALIRLKLVQGSDIISDASCNLTMFSSMEDTKLIDNQPTIYAAEGEYLYNWTANVDVGEYPLYGICAGGALNTNIVYGDGSIDVLDGAEMVTFG